MLQAVDESEGRRQILADEEGLNYRTACLGTPLPKNELTHTPIEGADVTYYSKLVHNGTVYHSEQVRGEGWTPFVTIKGVSEEGVKIVHFAHCQSSNKTYAVCRKLRVGNKPEFIAMGTEEVVTHLKAYEELEEFFACDVTDLGSHLYCVKGYLCAMPNPALRGYFHNDAM